jgi:hypothetical protein
MSTHIDETGTDFIDNDETIERTISNQTCEISRLGYIISELYIYAVITSFAKFESAG